MAALDGDLRRIASADPSTFDPKTGTRNEFLKGLTRKLQLTATGFNAFRTDPQLRQIRSELADRSSKTIFPNSRGGTFSCPDPQLQSALRGVVRAIDQLPEMGKPEIATVEGAQAVVEAFRRLTATFYGVLTFKLPPSADELRALQQKAVQSVENAAKRQSDIKVGQGGLSKRDYIPFAIALFVDLCLLLVSIGRPMNRLHGLVPKMRDAERGPVYQILSRFDDIHRDRKIREKFEVFRHVVFDFNGDYYVAVPLDAPRYTNVEEATALQQEAHLLSNLFASFEKEKIFSRVYNPILTRKMIQKKLARQGSKFAKSQAFRTYRFRDGAWSEIILGAVMGASRRADINRHREAQRRGPSLDLPEEQHQDEPRDAERDTFVTPQTIASELEPIGSVAANDPALAKKYGPYAQSMARDGGRRADPKRWPYQKPAPAPTEADVALHEPANSNTTPSRQAVDPGNVIQMPRSRPMEPENLEQPELHSKTVQPVVDQPTHVPAIDADPQTHIPEVILQPAPEPDPTINVRFTERTADFTVPVSEAKLPGHLFDAIETAEAGQLTLDLDANPSIENAAAAALEPPLVDDQPVSPADPATDQPIAIEADRQDPRTFIYGEDEDDPMLQVAARFAASRQPAE